MKKLFVILTIWTGVATAAETVIVFTPAPTPKTCTIFQGGLITCL